MIVYRLTNSAYINDLAGTGAKLYGGRWNSIGLNALYTTEHISLAVLEILVHIKRYHSPLDYYLVTIDIPSTAGIVSLELKKMKTSWKEDIAYGRNIGDDFLTTAGSLALKVPSAIIESESNFLVNPAHPDAGKLRILEVRQFIFDKRLLLK